MTVRRFDHQFQSSCSQEVGLVSVTYEAAIWASPTARHSRIATKVKALQDELMKSPQMPLSLSDASRMLCLEKTYCCKLFREVTGMSFTVWRRGIRLARSRDLLLRNEWSITDIAHASGFADVTTFERNFRRQFGMSPKQYRKLALEKRPLE